jgi:uncharacterized protein (DUF1800 family)
MKPWGTLVAVGLALGLGPAVGADEKGSGGLKPLPAAQWDYAKARHLLFRAGFGGSPAEVEKLCALGLDKAVDQLVDYQKTADVETPLKVEPPPEPNREELRKLSPEQKQKVVQQARRRDQDQMREIKDWWVRRMFQSPHPLEEKLVLFWHGHFATEFRTVRNSYAMYLQQKLFRDHAAGNFGKLLHGIVHDPAMLRYLDNNRNVKGRPNENLAREIMELFSLGEGNYSEKDIKEAARALTGYTFRRDGTFQFVSVAHDSGEKTIFGKNGDFDGDELVDLLLEQPACPKFIAKKLFVYFVHENPDEKTVQALANVLKNNYELRPLLKTMFKSQEFYSDVAMGKQVKSPAQLVVGSVRSLGLKNADPTAAGFAMRMMGQDLFEPPNVKGWEEGRAWINSNTLFARDNFAAVLVARSGGTPDILSVDPEQIRRRFAKGEFKAKGKVAKDFAGRAPFRPLAQGLDLSKLLEEQKFENPGEVVDYLTKAFFVVPVSEARRKELVEFAGQLPPSSKWAEKRQEVNARLAALLVLMLSMPEYQLT